MPSPASKPEKAAAEEDRQLGDAAYKKSQFDEAIGHYQDAWEQYPDIAYKNNESTARYQKEDYKGAIAVSLNGLENAEVETLTASTIARALESIGMCYVTSGDLRKAVEYFEKSVEKQSTPAREKYLAELKLEVTADRELGDKVADTILKSFAKLPKKRKPLEGGGKKEWVPLAGIVAQVDDQLSTISLGTGMKCLPFNKLPAAGGKVLHDWHAEVVALRSLNHFFLQEVNMIRGEGEWLHNPQESQYIRKLSFEERKNTLGRWHRDTPDYKYTIREGVRLHMYCSEAPCGDSSMELTMASQEDATPWEVAADGEGGLPGRAGFGQLGIVRRKPSRPDAPECRSKSCSDKLAQKQMTSVLNTLSSLLISPDRAYLETFTLPASQYVHEAWRRCFSEKGRLEGLKDVEANGGYKFRPFRALMTSKEFQYSRRSLGPNGEQPKPSNIAMAWSPHHDETIIGGILQGCKLSSPVKDEAASKTSRYKMWRTMEADLKGAKSESDKAIFAIDYASIKSKKRLTARREAKKAVRTAMMQGKPWIANTGDEAWALRSQEKPDKKGDAELSVEDDSEDSDAITDQAAEMAMRNEIVANNRKESPPTIHHMRTRGGVDEYQDGHLSESAERQPKPGSGSGQYEYEWLTFEGMRQRDPMEEVMEAFEKEEAEFQAEVNSEEYKNRHAFGEAMLDRMEKDDWDGYSKSEYHEAITMKATEKKKKKKKRAEQKSMEEIEADIRRELERKEQEREQELITHYPPTILESRVSEHGYVEYRVKYVKSLVDAQRSIYHAGWFLLAEMADLPGALEALENFHLENEEAVGPRKKDFKLAKEHQAPKKTHSGVRGPKEWKAILKLMEEQTPTILKSRIHPDTDDLEYKVKFRTRITDGGKSAHEAAWINWLDLCDIPAAIEAIVEFQRQEINHVDLDAMVPRSKDFTLAGPSSAAADYVRASVDARTEAESGMEIFKKRQARYKFIDQHIDQYHTTILDSRFNATHGAVEYYVVFLSCFADDGKPLHDMDWMLWFDIKDKPAFKDALEFFFKHHPEAVTPGQMELMMMGRTALDEDWCSMGKNGYPGAVAEIEQKRKLEELMAKYPPTILRSRSMDEYGHKEYNIKFVVRVTDAGKPIYSTDWSAESDLSTIPAAQKAVERFCSKNSKKGRPGKDYGEESDEESEHWVEDDSDDDSHGDSDEDEDTDDVDEEISQMEGLFETSMVGMHFMLKYQPKILKSRVEATLGDLLYRVKFVTRLIGPAIKMYDTVWVMSTDLKRIPLGRKAITAFHVRNPEAWGPGEESVQEYFETVLQPRMKRMAQYPPTILASRMGDDGHTEYYVQFFSGEKQGEYLRYDSEWMPGDDLRNTPAAKEALSDEDMDWDDEDNSEDDSQDDRDHRWRLVEEHPHVVLKSRVGTDGDLEDRVALVLHANDVATQKKERMTATDLVAVKACQRPLWDFFARFPEANGAEEADCILEAMEAIHKKVDVDELMDGQPKKEDGRIMLEGPVLGNIKYKLQKKTDEQPPMNSQETRKFKKWPKEETGAYQEKSKKLQVEMMRTQGDTDLKA